MAQLIDALLPLLRYALALLGLGFVAACLPRLLRRRRTAPQKAFLMSVIHREKLPLARCENSVGRSPRCDVVLNYPTVSRFHAVIALRREGWVLIDTGSRGGTKIDGRPLEDRAALEHGQCITFGSTEFMFYDPAQDRETALGNRSQERF